MMRHSPLYKALDFDDEEPPKPPKITYKVMLIDYFEGDLITVGEDGYDFTDKDLAIQKRDERNLSEFKTATPLYDHYCVIEVINGNPVHEIDCPARFKLSE